MPINLPAPPTPRVYKPSLASKIFVALAGTLLIGFGLGVPTLFFWTGVTYRFSDAPIWAWFLSGTSAIVFPIMSIRFMSRALRAKVVWSKDALEIFGRRGHQVLQTAEIVGRRYVVEERGRNVELLTKVQSGDRFVIPLDWVLSFDSDFERWINAIPEVADKLSK